MRKLLMPALLLVTSLFSTAVLALEPVEGRNYITLNSPVPTQQPEKVEVVAMFGYSCPYCYQLESSLTPWSASLADDVDFIRVPAMFGGTWDLHGQLFYTLQTMQVLEQMHDTIFDALHNANRKLSSVNQIASFVAEQGIDKEVFLKTWNSFSVKSQVEKAKKLALAYQISGVPTLVVNGKYRFDVGMAGGMQETVDVADSLIDKERQSK
jgi:thiol:disulfide interchange protein DsbA